MRNLFVLGFVLLLAAGMASAGEKALMHCFAFTALDSATEADWQAFHKATDALPAQIPGLTKVWYGKLRNPVAQLSATNGADYQKMRDAKAGEELSIPVRKDVRQYGVCMEMKDAAALKSYADSPAHKAWVAVYEKVRKPGTLTLDLLGQ